MTRENKSIKRCLWLSLGACAFLVLALFVELALPISSASASQARFWPVYRSGKRDENVRSIQYMLRQQGDTLDANGQFSDQTASSVKSFQEQNDLNADGVVNAVTWVKLIVQTQQGSNGDAVVALQRQLNAHSAHLNVNGQFDAQTLAAVKSFQSRSRIATNGVADLDTWNRLVGGYVGERKGNADGYALLHAPTVTAAFINRVLDAYDSPAQGKGQALYDTTVRYGIDPVYALAFFQHESTFGKYGIASVTNSLGNIRCTPDYACADGFRMYSSWEASFVDWCELIRQTYIEGWHLSTVDQIIPRYAPASENDVQGYIQAVKQSVNAWRAGRVNV